MALGQQRRGGTIVRMNGSSFFSLAEMKQPVNQWLCIAFLGLLCFWTVLYYFTESAQAVGENFAVQRYENLQNSEIRTASHIQAIPESGK